MANVKFTLRTFVDEDKARSEIKRSKAYLDINQKFGNSNTNNNEKHEEITKEMDSVKSMKEKFEKEMISRSTTTETMQRKLKIVLDNSLPTSGLNIRNEKIKFISNKDVKLQVNSTSASTSLPSHTRSDVSAPENEVGGKENTRLPLRERRDSERSAGSNKVPILSNGNNEDTSISATMMIRERIKKFENKIVDNKNKSIIKTNTVEETKKDNFSFNNIEIKYKTINENKIKTILQKDSALDVNERNNTSTLFSDTSNSKVNEEKEMKVNKMKKINTKDEVKDIKFKISTFERIGSKNAPTESRSGFKVNTKLVSQVDTSKSAEFLLINANANELKNLGIPNSKKENVLLKEKENKENENDNNQNNLVKEMRMAEAENIQNMAKDLRRNQDVLTKGISVKELQKQFIGFKGNQEISQTKKNLKLTTFRVPSDFLKSLELNVNNNAPKDEKSVIKEKIDRKEINPINKSIEESIKNIELLEHNSNKRLVVEKPHVYNSSDFSQTNELVFSNDVFVPTTSNNITSPLKMNISFKDELEKCLSKIQISEASDEESDNHGSTKPKKDHPQEISFNYKLKDFITEGKDVTKNAPRYQNSSEKSRNNVFIYRIGKETEEEKITDWSKVEDVVVKTKEEIQKEKQMQEESKVKDYNMENSIKNNAPKTNAKSYKYKIGEKTEEEEEDYNKGWTSVNEVLMKPKLDTNDLSNTPISADDKHQNLNKFIQNHVNNVNSKNGNMSDEMISNSFSSSHNKNIKHGPTRIRNTSRPEIPRDFKEYNKENSREDLEPQPDYD